eukprot:NODE_536_length_7014_cov_0.311208.p3 type:complete len:201 gc:universal NODE_536_length_7014_cov_0.311208:437-1039(+)
MFKKRLKAKLNLRVAEEETSLTKKEALQPKTSLNVESDGTDIKEVEVKDNIEILEVKQKQKSQRPVLSEEEKLSRKRKLFDGSTMEADYNPMICRPYFETGYCGFGDNCIYRHDREEITHSYELKMNPKVIADKNEYCFGCRNNVNGLQMMLLSCKDMLCRNCATSCITSKRCLKCKKAVEPSIRPVERKTKKYKKSTDA